MSEATSQPSGPDFAQGLALAQLADGAMLLGCVGEQPVLLARRGGEVFAIDATCTHYGGPLAEGLLVEDTVRCPWHHACFSLRTGEALRPPALNPVACWRVEQQGDRIVVREKAAAVAPKPAPLPASGVPGSIVILGGGAAGNSAAEALRREGYGGRILMLSADPSVPCDRPNLSKDYLAGNASEEWIPLRPPEFYREHRIELRLGVRATAIDAALREIRIEDGSHLVYDALLIATGAEPVRLDVPGGDLPHVHTLRSLADSRAIIATAKGARRALVIGASFIGLEAAAALRTRNVEVHVVAPEARPMERVLGPQLGDFIRALHEEHGVVFHLGETVTAIDGRRATLKSGGVIEADLVVVGIGVRPRLTLAEQSGLTVDRGVVVDPYLQTSAAAVYAAGDIARWPDPHSGGAIRVEHWVVAERQGQTAARNMLGFEERFDAVPFFWSQHYDVPINYVGHAERWDEISIDGQVDGKDCLLRYKSKGRVLAVASIYRDVESLKAELAMEQGAVP
jgi:NADPH-dependent 2,4-dienoyl-CoA reductase/sulfur reductase-like enzyme/nitrite reductase/ring-hydroxylating ferredoxin subunit